MFVGDVQANRTPRENEHRFGQISGKLKHDKNEDVPTGNLKVPQTTQ